MQTGWGGMMMGLYHSDDVLTRTGHVNTVDGNELLLPLLILSSMTRILQLFIQHFVLLETNLFWTPIMGTHYSDCTRSIYLTLHPLSLQVRTYDEHTLTDGRSHRCYEIRKLFSRRIFISRPPWWVS